MISILQNLSLRVRLISVYVFILGMGGLITSFIGSLIVNETLMNQARSKVHHDLNTARMVYEKQLKLMENSIYIGASGNTIQQTIYQNDRTRLISRLKQIQRDCNLDFLSVADSSGRVMLRLFQQNRLGDNVSVIPLVKAALNGSVVSGTEVLSQQLLANENEQLAEQARIQILDTPKARPTMLKELTSGLVLMAAAPFYNDRGELLGVLYGGHLINRNFMIIDQVWTLVYEGEKYQGKDVGTVTIFLNDLRISTNVRTSSGERAIGTRLSAEVAEAVLSRGERWTGRAFVVNDWYISEYEPIKDFSGNTVGVLYVGLLEKAYLAIRNKVIFTFMIVATIGFFMIVGISYLITRSITRPLSEMVTVTQAIARGDLNHRIRVKSKDEIGQLALSFNKMVASLRKMRAELEQWANTLEQKVKERTEELAAMQNTLIQSQRLASLGKMAAGIAHEINNPLGGILVLSSLVLEDLKPEDPHRENLQEVIKQTMRCRDIVKGLLQFSRQEEGKSEYVNLNDVLNNTLSLLEKQALFHNIEVIKDFDPNLPQILGDPSQMQQVFMNIILNAVQAMKEIGTLTLVTRHDKKNDLVVVDVTDTGCGIPEELIDRIFDPFFTTKEVGEGTGLGLSIAYGIVTKHHGRMSVKSKVNEGSTFTIKIPAVSSSQKGIVEALSSSTTISDAEK
ncbi:MAG: cache domain-containing protein [candidate division KSB1 bacterium]|nr:cache domain-containing protein [candidate division KSB1 bacterium]MDZ7335544.1 cache domain-containing protein [candidate division KSB1 bacterium]MDZ7356910.1 cache domain-containing protein [candidate division KSB1 bacterium]MDZ7377498.1 cache domain-containing protein [candidate division KSB1 bacterium]MDZ7399259.1 cache domain-containing protein [candidate division KSB1 bacterium]